MFRKEHLENEGMAKLLRQAERTTLAALRDTVSKMFKPTFRAQANPCNMWGKGSLDQSEACQC